jgi:hypothetical protein
MTPTRSNINIGLTIYRIGIPQLRIHHEDALCWFGLVLPKGNIPESSAVKGSQSRRPTRRVLSFHSFRSSSVSFALELQVDFLQSLSTEHLVVINVSLWTGFWKILSKISIRNCELGVVFYIDIIFSININMFMARIALEIHPRLIISRITPVRLSKCPPLFSVIFFLE